ncbi:helix-turn-helix domain-containing protein [Kitasatospora sp. NPDC051984]|uniref:helix-turn-helix domain-containing protein n=1 Tax=Kitasatospora sp. NPDC051984 TaxID=3364059 RepID=UPI0037CAE43C
MNGRRDEFVRLRREAGFTQETLAAAMSVERSTASRWERGHAAPRPWQLPKLAQLLKVEQGALAAALRDPVTSGGPEDSSGAQSGRRGALPMLDGPSNGVAEAMSGVSAMAMADGRAHAGYRTPDGQVVFLPVPRQVAPGGPSPLGTADSAESLAPALGGPFSELPPDLPPVESLRILRRSLAECDNILGPRNVLATAREHIYLVQRLRRDASGHDRQAMLQVLAEYAEFCSWLYHDSGDHGAAQYWADRAADWANACGDQDLATYITARKAQLAGDMRSSADAVDLAEYAQRLARPGSRLSAMGAVYGAHGHALLGDERTAQYGFDHAIALLTEPTEPPVGRGRWLTAAYVEAQRARSLSLLGRHREAVAGFEQAIRVLPAGFRRDRGVYLARAAVAQFEADGPEQAAATGAAAVAVAAATGSARIFTELATLDMLLQRCRGVPEVEHFREVLDSVLLHKT